MHEPNSNIAQPSDVIAKINGNVFVSNSCPVGFNYEGADVIFTLENGSIRQLLIWTLTIKVLIKTPNSVHLFA